MPIISHIGRRSRQVRLLFAGMYFVLIAGSLTMIYPLLLMLAGSVKSEADAWSIKPYPEFWFNERILFQKFAEAKYNAVAAQAQQAWCAPVLSWRALEPPPAVDYQLIQDFRAWRETIPVEQRLVGFAAAPGLLPKNLRSYRRWMARYYAEDMAAYNKAANQAFYAWSYVIMPVEIIGRYLNQKITDEFRQVLNRWKQTVPASDLIVVGARGQFALDYLPKIYGSRIDGYNRAHQTSYASYGEIPFPERVPAAAGRTRDDWERFVRREIQLRYVELAPALAPAFRRFLEREYETIEKFNRERRTNFATFTAVPFPARVDDAPYLRVDFERFLGASEWCPIESVRIRSADEEFADYLRRKHGRVPDAYPGLGAVVAAADWADCMEHKVAVRWEFTRRNFVQVLDYLALHGNGLINTVIYCSLAVLTALIVNPLAAYALSRFKLPATYKILLFCMATMAFPEEVQMIPSFILLKRFPLWPILTGLAVTLAVFYLLEKLLPHWREGWRALLSLAAGLGTGALLLPRVLPDYTTTSLLNNFAALILPRMANGYSIFLLKGFFDSLPRELYEAADLDGANEWTKFWMLTMNLSKPILAVIALGAFTHAYSQFMMALIIIPDQRMWTIMVWIFQLQSQSHQAVVFASLVIAAIPTLLIFILCQNIILRGIVVPTEK